MPDFHEYYFYVFNLIPKFTDNEKWGYHKGKLLNGHAQTQNAPLAFDPAQ